MAFNYSFIPVTSPTQIYRVQLPVHKPEEACSVEMTPLTDTFCWHLFVLVLH